MTQRASLQTLPWDVIRAEYETTEISIRALAARHGMTSDTTIRRKMAAGNWVKNHAAITAGLVTTAVAQALTGDVSADPPRAPFAIPPARLSDIPDVGEMERGHRDGRPLKRDRKPERPSYADVCAPPHTSEIGSSAGPPPVAVTVRDRVRTASEEASDAADAATVDLSTRLAAIHAQEIVRQVAVADELITLGRQVLALMQAALMGDAEEATVASRRLMLSDRNDGMASSADAAQKMIERGFLMKRRALGMDGAGGRPAVGSAANGGMTTDIQKVVGRMDPDMLKRIREIAQDGLRGRLTPAVSATTIEGIAVPDAEVT